MCVLLRNADLLGASINCCRWPGGGDGVGTKVIRVYLPPPARPSHGHRPRGTRHRLPPSGGGTPSRRPAQHTFSPCVSNGPISLCAAAAAAAKDPGIRGPVEISPRRPHKLRAAVRKVQIRPRVSGRNSRASYYWNVIFAPMTTTTKYARQRW